MWSDHFLSAGVGGWSSAARRTLNPARSAADDVLMAIRAWCRKRGWEVEADRLAGGVHRVLRARTPDGREVAVKRSPVRGAHELEARALAALAAEDLAPAVVASSPRHLATAWVDGPTAAAAGPDRHAAVVGAACAHLAALPPVPGAEPVTGRFGWDWSFAALPPSRHLEAAALLEAVEACPARGAAHGDLHPGNVLLATPSRHGALLIDPVGACGCPGWDVGQYAAGCADPWRALEVLLAVHPAAACHAVACCRYHLLRRASFHARTPRRAAPLLALADAGPALPAAAGGSIGAWSSASAC
jgi:hypothetical protein